MRDLARNLFAFARTAGTVLAAVGHADALAQASGQQSFVRLCAESAATGLDRDVETHLWVSLCN
jgi:hypothetical protein